MRAEKMLLLCASVAAFVAGWQVVSPSGLAQVRARAEDAEALRQDVAGLERENARLEAEAKRLQDGEQGSAGLESVVREELGWIRPDEHLLLLPAEEPERDAAGGAP
ncbi:MAG: FtsB family cell division protein [Myxococcota bacterium]